MLWAKVPGSIGRKCHPGSGQLLSSWRALSGAVGATSPSLTRSDAGWCPPRSLSLPRRVLGRGGCPSRSGHWVAGQVVIDGCEIWDERVAAARQPRRRPRQHNGAYSWGAPPRVLARLACFCQATLPLPTVLTPSPGTPPIYLCRSNPFLFMKVKVYHPVSTCPAENIEGEGGSAISSPPRTTPTGAAANARQTRYQDRALPTREWPAAA